MASEGHKDETYKSLLSIATEALRSLLLLNGGAVVAILAYLGQLGDQRATAAWRARSSLGWFIAGLVLAMAAFMFSYLTQHALFNEDANTGRTRISHEVWQWTGFGTAFLSLASCAFGAWTA